MKFLGKTNASKILKEGLTYQENKGKNNLKLREMLVDEQSNFCAYTEKYFECLDSVEVEHFNSSKKYRDDYFNYYAVIRKSNQDKKDNKYRLKAKNDESFFGSLFFQNNEEFNKRIEYDNGEYYAVEENDFEADEFIDFIGLNSYSLHQDRRRHIERVKSIIKLGGLDEEKLKDFFRNHKETLSFITALEIELQIDLSEFLSKEGL